MVFKWKVTKPSFAQAVNGVELKRLPIECEFETGSPEEALGIFQDSENVFKAIFGHSPLEGLDFGASGEVGQAPPAANDEVPTKKERKPRTPKVEAIAPDPIPVPDTPPLVLAPPLAPVASGAAPLLPLGMGSIAATPIPTPPTSATLAVPALIPAPVVDAYAAAARCIDPAMPAFLDRTAAPPAPPPPQVTPPLPVAPPVGVLGPKIVEALQTRVNGGEDPQAWSKWLAECGLTIAGASFDDACRAVLMISDVRLDGAATQLGIGA